MGGKFWWLDCIEMFEFQKLYCILLYITVHRADKIGDSNWSKACAWNLIAEQCAFDYIVKCRIDFKKIVYIYSTTILRKSGNINQIPMQKIWFHIFLERLFWVSDCGGVRLYKMLFKSLFYIYRLFFQSVWCN